MYVCMIYLHIHIYIFPHVKSSKHRDITFQVVEKQAWIGRVLSAPGLASNKPEEKGKAYAPVTCSSQDSFAYRSNSTAMERSLF